jgi:hypothetical protein
VIRPLSLSVVLVSCAELALAEADVWTAVSVEYFECTDPKSSPTCVSSDERSKERSCPGCRQWSRVKVEENLSIKPKPSYEQPRYFLDDVSKQMFGASATQGAAGQPVPVRDIYANPAKYGWVEVNSPKKEGTIALFPETAGVVIAQESPKEVKVLYSSTKMNGAVTRTDVGNLTTDAESVKYVIPKAYLDKATKRPE